MARVLTPAHTLGARYSHSSLFMIRCVFLKESGSQQADEEQLAVLQIAAHRVSNQSVFIMFT